MSATLALPVAPAAILEALADVVGEEPSPLHTECAARSPLPGLGPLARLRREVRAYVDVSQRVGVSHEVVRLVVLRAVDSAMPSFTPEWSQHLLREEVDRWCAEAYGL